MKKRELSRTVRVLSVTRTVVESSVVGRGRDDYDRELAEVFLPDGRSLNRELVAAGFAWWFRRHSTDRGLEALEREARAARRGLWADPNPVPPWAFRAGNQRVRGAAK